MFGYYLKRILDTYSYDCIPIMDAVADIASNPN